MANGLECPIIRNGKMVPFFRTIPEMTFLVENRKCKNEIQDRSKKLLAVNEISRIFYIRYIYNTLLQQGT